MASQIDYQSVGSGSGVKSVIDKTVDFGASDAAMTPEDMAKVDGGVQLLPMTAGCIVLTYNLKGVTGLKLSRAGLCGNLPGKVKKWNDPLIAKDESRREPSRRTHQRGGPRRWQWHHLRVHQTPERHQSGIRQEPRRQHASQLARREPAPRGTKA